MSAQRIDERGWVISLRQNVRDNAALNELEWQLLSYWIPTIVSAAVLLVFMKGAVSLRALWFHCGRCGCYGLAHCVGLFLLHTAAGRKEARPPQKSGPVSYSRNTGGGYVACVRDGVGLRVTVDDPAAGSMMSHRDTCRQVKGHTLHQAMATNIRMIRWPQALYGSHQWCSLRTNPNVVLANATNLSSTVMFGPAMHYICTNASALHTSRHCH